MSGENFRFLRINRIIGIISFFGNTEFEERGKIEETYPCIYTHPLTKYKMNTPRRRNNENIKSSREEIEVPDSYVESMKTVPLTVQTTNDTYTSTNSTDGAASSFVHTVTDAILSDGDEDNSESDYESDDSENSYRSEGQTLIRIPSVEGIVRGFETTVEDDEHMEYINDKRASFSSMTRSMSRHLLMEDDNNKSRRSLNIIFGVIKLIKQNFTGIKRVTFFVYIGFILLTFRAGELKSLNVFAKQ